MTTYPNFARVKGNFTGVDSPDSFYKTFCNGTAAPTAAAAPAPSTTSSAPVAVGTAPGYPVPVVISSDHVVSGYYLPNSDVAVLSMLSFEPKVPIDFQVVVETFIAAAKADGKTKLVIDVSANGGGYILQGYDTFRQLFPQIVQDGFTRFRQSDGLRVISEQFAAVIPADYSPDTASADMISMYESVPNYRYDYNQEGKHFSTYEEKFGDHVYKGDNYTNLIRWDLDDPLTTVNATYGMGEEITGYGSRKNFTQPFAAEDIIILYDGYCASTCTLFSEFMRTQAGIKSIAMGGRTPHSTPNATIPIIQAVGGIKGANNFAYADLGYYAGLAYNSGTPAQQAQANWTVLKDLQSTLPIDRSIDTSINVRDNILRANLEDGTPSQFLYEPADCRLFYTPAMMADVTQIWIAAADAAFGNGKCAAGSLPARNATMGVAAKRQAQRVAKRRGTKVVKSAVVPVEKAPVWHAMHGRKVPL